jgi:hypothetical protein
MIKLACKNLTFREKVVRVKKVKMKNQAQVDKKKTSTTWTRLYFL